MGKPVTFIDGVTPSVTTAVNAYTAPSNGNGSRILAFAASINSGVETYTVYIGATATDAIIPATSVSGPGSDTPFDLINHIIPPGDSLWYQVSTGSTITLRASGREL